MSTDLLRAFAIRAGYKQRFNDLARMLGWNRRTLDRRLSDPDAMTVAELRVYARTTGMSADEIVELIRGEHGRESYGAHTLRRSEGHDARK